MALTTPASADKLDDVKARGRLLVGVTESSPPFSYLVPGKGIVGYDVDLAERVAKSLGVKTEKIAIINAERIAALQQDRVDLVAVTRRELEKALTQEWLRARRSAAPLALLLADIEGFTAYNAEFGEEKANACLKSVADGLRSAANLRFSRRVMCGNKA